MSVAVRPFLMFEGKAEEAMQTYVSLVPGSKIIELQKRARQPRQGRNRDARRVLGGGQRWCSAPTASCTMPSPSRRPSRSSWTASQAQLETLKTLSKAAAR